MTGAVVYRLYDKDDRLLYIGSSTNVHRRLIQHRSRETWGKSVARVTTSAPFADRLDAFHAETGAIRSERPRHNRTNGAVTRERTVMMSSILGESFYALMRTWRSWGSSYQDMAVMLNSRLAQIAGGREPITLSHETVRRWWHVMENA